MKALVLFGWIVLIIFSNSMAFAAGRFDFKGLYVGLNGDQAKKLGLTCQNPSNPRVKLLYDEKCTPSTGNENFSTFGGEKITLMEISIKSNAVQMIYIKTMGQYDGNLDKNMTAKYGKPKESSGSWKKGSYFWTRGGTEFISLDMHNGVNEVIFGYDNSKENELKAKQNAKKASGDF